MPLAKVGDLNLNYTVQGSGDWLVLIGGYASSNWQSWGAMLTELAKSYRVLAFDNRGIGGSDVPDYPYSTPMLARDTLGLMDHLEIKNARVLGKSMGGAIAQWVVLEQPQRVKCLAMTSTTAKLDSRSRKMVRWWMDTARDSGFEKLFPGELTYFYTAQYYDANPEAIARAEQALISVHRPLKGFLHMGHALINHDTWDRLGEITMPVFLLCGADDMITPARHSEEMARRMPNAEVHIVPHTLHGVMSEKPETFKRVLEFLRRN
jgi:pimeloyl-ACP methyl ester carboxylesterase